MSKTGSKSNVIAACELSIDYLQANPGVLIGQKQLAAFLGISEKTLEKQRWAGTGIRYVKIGSAVRYIASDVLEYIRQSTVETTAAVS